jgi:hypothetical protein
MDEARAVIAILSQEDNLLRKHSGIARDVDYMLTVS